MIYVKPQRRTIKRGMSGPDVRATKYALKAAGFKKGIVLTNRAGAAWQNNLKAFQRKHKLKVDGQYGAKTHAALRPFIARVPYATWLWNHTPKPISASVAIGENLRERIVNTALFGARHEPSIHYTQSSRRMSGVRGRLRPPAFGRYEDCSSFSTWCYWVAGAADPNGLGYNGQGYTGTLAAHGRLIPPRRARPGDLVFYGGGFPYTHVAVYIGGGRIVSHGSESGPKVTSMNYRPVSAVRSYLP